MTAIRTLGPGKLTITDTGKGRDFSAQVTKVQLAASNNTDDPINFLDGSQDTSTSTDSTPTTSARGASTTLASRCRSSGCRTTRARSSGRAT